MVTVATYFAYNDLNFWNYLNVWNNLKIDVEFAFKFELNCWKFLLQ